MLNINMHACRNTSLYLMGGVIIINTTGCSSLIIFISIIVCSSSILLSFAGFFVTCLCSVLEDQTRKPLM